MKHRLLFTLAGVLLGVLVFGTGIAEAAPLGATRAFTTTTE